MIARMSFRGVIPGSIKRIAGKKILLYSLRNISHYFLNKRMILSIYILNRISNTKNRTKPNPKKTPKVFLGIKLKQKKKPKVSRNQIPPTGIRCLLNLANTFRTCQNLYTE